MSSAGIDPVEFGKAMGELVRDATTPLKKRIADLEVSVDQTKAADQLDLIEDLQDRVAKLERRLESME